MPSTSAAAAVAIGAENDVPSAWRNSNGPQSEYPWSSQAALVGLVTLNGRVEKMSEPGAEMSLCCVSRSENSGTLPVTSSALTPMTCGRAAGYPAKFHGDRGAWSELPTAATTRTFLLTAYLMAAASSGE